MMNEITLIFQENPTLFLTLFGVLGLCVGSFVNVVIYRIPIMLEQQWASHLQTASSGTNGQNINLFFPRSHCPHCKKPLAALSNIPIFSYLYQGGKSACCRQPISFRYPFVEALGMILSIFIGFQYGPSLQCFGALFFTWSLLALFFIDLDQKILPDSITLPLIWAGLLINSFQIFTTVENALFGATIGYLIFWAVAFIFKYFRRVEGLGQGDFKLLAACGAWLGLQLVPFIILVSSITGLIVGSFYLLTFQKNVRTQIPFGPFIAIAAFIALIWGDKLIC